MEDLTSSLWLPFKTGLLGGRAEEARGNGGAAQGCRSTGKKRPKSGYILKVEPTQWMGRELAPRLSLQVVRMWERRKKSHAATAGHPLDPRPGLSQEGRDPRPRSELPPQPMLADGRGASDCLQALFCYVSIFQLLLPAHKFNFQRPLYTSRTGDYKETKSV